VTLSLLFRKRRGRFDIETLEASTATDIIDRMATYGFAIKRGLLDQITAARLYENAQRVYLECDAAGGNHPLMTNRDYNTVKLEALDAPGAPKFASAKAVIDTLLYDVYERTIGKNWIVSLDESPVFRANAGASHYTVPTRWHQDACVNAYPTALVWIALSECGTDAPGVKLACKAVPSRIPTFLDEHAPDKPKERYIARYLGDVMAAPTFESGDALFFNDLSIHGTHITPDMKRDRTSFKITGVPRAFAGQCARTLDPQEL